MFEFLDLDLKRYMDSLPDRDGLSPNLVKVSSFVVMLVEGGVVAGLMGPAYSPTCAPVAVRRLTKETWHYYLVDRQRHGPRRALGGEQLNNNDDSNPMADTRRRSLPTSSSRACSTATFTACCTAT